MNVLEISDEELEEMYNSVVKTWSDARIEMDRIVALREEKARLVALKHAFGQITAAGRPELNTR